MSNTYSKSKRQFKISEENVICSIPAYDCVIGKCEDKAVRLLDRQKPTKENVKGEPPCVLCVNVQSQNFLHTYFLLAEFSVRTVNYGPSFFPSIYGPSAKHAGRKSMEKTRIRNLQYGPKKRG